MNIIGDFHHNDLFYSLYLLFEKTSSYLKSDNKLSRIKETKKI
jgi:hypothetical protein